MATLSIEFKRKIADAYLQNRQRLDKLDPNAMESFASELLKLIEREKEQSQA